MYAKPRLDTFGSFRELTQVGFSGSSDGATFIGVTGGVATGSGCTMDNYGNMVCAPGRS